MKRSLEVVVLLAILFALSRYGSRLHSQEFNKYYENTLNNLCPPNCLIPGEKQQKTTAKETYSQNDWSAEGDFPELKTSDDYTVKRGDTLFSIANEFRVSVVDLKNANKINDDSIKAGEVLKIPSNATLGKANRVMSGELAPDAIEETENSVHEEGSDGKKAVPSVENNDPKEIFKQFEDSQAISETKGPELVQAVQEESPEEEPATETPVEA
ncbi:MAG: LysM peptidoglycan-binding domain-containing protein, partial [Thermodesulfobacteriota bacterium]